MEGSPHGQASSRAQGRIQTHSYSSRFLYTWQKQNTFLVIGYATLFLLRLPIYHSTVDGVTVDTTVAGIWLREVALGAH